MKPRFYTLAILLLATAAFAYQRFDLAGYVDEKISIGPVINANGAKTGTAVDLASYQGAALFVQTGVADNAAYTVYTVIQDSAASRYDSTAWAAVDSTSVDSVDNTVKELAYRGAKRYVRAIMRASGNAADSIYAAAAFIVGPKRSR